MSQYNSEDRQQIASPFLTINDELRCLCIREFGVGVLGAASEKLPKQDAKAPNVCFCSEDP